MRLSRAASGTVPAAALGAAAGFIGAVLAHVLVTALNRLGADGWLRGSYGPPFFDISLYMGVLYGAIGWGGTRSFAAARNGFLISFLVLSLPMAVLTHLARSFDAALGSWYWVVSVLYVGSTWLTTFALGMMIVDGGAVLKPITPRKIAGALGAGAGALLGYFVLNRVVSIFGNYLRTSLPPTSFSPPPIELLDGLFSGLGLVAGVTFVRRYYDAKARA